ncbi:RNA polymerase II elongation factor ELL3 [Canis lupus baileyi]|uniref:Elongation factor for RNA polymerase II 3 n=3 Tax=Canis lupus TaxID=9612 RepID=A0A8C0NM92_CANLF|nr:RNA polymerase II elongation factor ELL3 [Canis lupus dingo]XP_038298102.1 RNA polymerase II elongation factor ELL3 [Canis lupus familiaris]XP_038436197.1 RNA polymerase II elongation factor ELL3 [Canis lupus familiaris]XP_544650.2 RNA polymerase II elongation factor ELL3 [Canis lupus familiaris]|eukprot:XP_544650.2 RNA polymerase II elongation factor ELL3 [Canis lupus familiaris]
MEGPRELLSGKFQLCFTPAAGTSLLMLRLNDAALRALQECRRQQVRPVIAFQGNRGYLRFPGPGWSCLFSFTVSQCGQDGPGGGLDLVCQRLGRSGPNHLHCLGPLRERLTIWAAMDSIPAPSSVRRHILTDSTRDPDSWQNIGDYSEEDTVSQPQMALQEVSDPLASSQGQSLPGSSKEHMAHWEVRNQTHLPNRKPDQALPSSESQKHLDKKRPAPATSIGLKEKRLRPLPLAPSPLQVLPSQDLQEGEDWEQEDKDEDIGPRLEHSPSVQADSESPSPEEVPDYLLQYRAIHSAEQQHAYEQDFETDYTEYRILHARVGAASQRFIELGAEIKRVQRGTPEYKMLEEKIVQEYKKFRKRYPGYREEKRRCEYLHQKLSHIKGLILEFEEKNRGS